MQIGYWVDHNGDAATASEMPLRLDFDEPAHFEFVKDTLANDRFLREDGVRVCDGFVLLPTEQAEFRARLILDLTK